MLGYYQLIESSDGRASFQLRAGNHEVILTGAPHHSRDAALKAVEWLRTHGVDPSRFERRSTAAGGRYFVVLRSDGELIGRSATYGRSSGLDVGIASVQRNCMSDSFRGLVRRTSLTDWRPSVLASTPELVR